MRVPLFVLTSVLIVGPATPALADPAVPLQIPTDDIPEPLAEVVRHVTDLALLGTAEDTLTQQPPEEEPGEETGQAEDAQQPEPAEDATAPEAPPPPPPPPPPEEEPAPPADEPAPEGAFLADLALTRDLAAQSAPSITEINLPQPLAGFVDVRLGPRSTVDIIDTLVAAGATPAEIARILAPFPVAGPAQYGNDWGAPRHTPSFHAHEGTDVFASRGTPVIASMDGVVSNLAADTAIGGNSLRVTAPDGTFAYYAHLDGFAPGVADGTPVSVGSALGYVGTSGNAAGGAPHLHFEIHPGGGEAIPPLPYLDAWLVQARQEVAAYATPQRPVPVSAAAAPVAPVSPVSPTAVWRDSSESAANMIGTLLLLGLATVITRLVRRRRRAPARVWQGRFRAVTLDDLAEPSADGTGPVRDVLAPLLGRKERE